MSLLDRIKTLREKNGNISINRLEKEAGLTRGSISKWDDHAPSYEKLKKVADYFGVSVLELTGEQEKKPPADGEELSPEEKELYEILDSSSPEVIRAILEVAKVIKKQEGT